MYISLRKISPISKNRNPELESILIPGFQTNYGGIFLLLPYLVNLGIDKLVCLPGIKKEKGISIKLIY
jgi:hypothetical protein